MRIIYNYDYVKATPCVDILVRVYGNQDPQNTDEKVQCVGEILFKDYLRRDHDRFQAWLPRGIAAGVISGLLGVIKSPGFDNNWVVGISNEFHDTIGVLTSCRENFKNSLVGEAERRSFPFAIEGLAYTPRSAARLQAPQEPPLMATYDEWKRMGYQVQRGERSESRNGYGVCVFSFTQVKKL